MHMKENFVLSMTAMMLGSKGHKYIFQGLF